MGPFSLYTEPERGKSKCEVALEVLVRPLLCLADALHSQPQPPKHRYSWVLNMPQGGKVQKGILVLLCSQDQGDRDMDVAQPRLY